MGWKKPDSDHAVRSCAAVESGYAPQSGYVARRSDAVRTAVRFPLHLALHLKTECGTVDAITHDISSSGLLFSTPRLAGVGSVIEFSLDMPSELMGWKRDVSIDCVGRVIRHQFAGQETMMAAEIEQYSLRAQL